MDCGVRCGAGCLTGLSALELSFGDLPRSVSALTALQCLSLEDAPNTNAALGAVLPQLRQLTCLMLMGWSALETQVVEMAGLSRVTALVGQQRARGGGLCLPAPAPRALAAQPALTGCRLAHAVSQLAVCGGLWSVGPGPHRGPSHAQR